MLIAATHSGAGKTTATAVVLRTLRRRGLTAQPFKLGPDFIDAAYHAEAAGRPSINLDVWMMGEEGVRRSFSRWSEGVDAVVVEAMGALYDGDHGSAADVAKLLGLPVVVVLDVWGMTRTAAAILDGLRSFDPEVEIAGCILNRVGSPAHAAMVADALPGLVLGTIRARAELAIPERHLGLVTVEENAAGPAARECAQLDAGASLDIDRLRELAGRPARPPRRIPPAPAPTARLAIARDEAFCFYYEENLLLLRDAGFDLAFFRPTGDGELPADTDAVYLGGGYPESFAAELAANAPLAAELRERAAAGMPIYAECGGLIYLARSLTRADGVRYPMAGVLPLDVAMDAEHLAIRYVEARTRAPSPLGDAGTSVRGQEFHQSRIVAANIAPTLYDVTSSDRQTSRDGYLVGTVVASYLHLHFAWTPDLVASLRQCAIEARRTISA